MVPPMKRVTGVGLAHRFPGTGLLFTGLDVTLNPGEVVAVVGPSGSGKSTLLSILAGWLTPVAGTVTRTGIGHTGWVFQNPVGVPGRTAVDHVVLPLLARGRSRSQAVVEALGVMGRFGLDQVAGRRFRDLSGGEAQRLMLARAVAAGNDLLLVDEPTAQLDMATAATVSQVLGNIAQDDVIVVVATHDPHTRDACTRVIDLADYQAGNQADTDHPAESRGGVAGLAGVDAPSDAGAPAVLVVPPPMGESRVGLPPEPQTDEPPTLPPPVSPSRVVLAEPLWMPAFMAKYPPSGGVW